MNGDVTICVATFGPDPMWQELANTRALPSARALGAPTVHVHRSQGTLAQARNAALAHVDTEWVAFLDADDELDPGYLDAMAAVDGDVRAPAVCYVTPRAPRGRPKMPRVSGHKHACTGDCLPAGNWVVIGALARASLVRQVGGFREWPVYEDWDLWLRMWLAGARVAPVDRAIYRAHYRPDSRNRGGDPQDRVAVHWQIHQSIYGEATA